jgi:hypothetical protein
VLANWGDSVSPGDRTCGDVDVDGTINSGDLNVVRAYWGNGTPPGRAASGSSSSLARPPVTIDDVDNSSQRSLSGYVTQDLLFEAVQDWLSAELRLELTSGRLYQDRYGSDLTPSEALIDAHPTVEYDTYLSANGRENATLTIGGAVDLGGSAGLTMNETSIDAAWFGTSDTDIGDVLLSRVTISDDAVGIWSLLVSDVGGGSYLVSGTISKGVMRLTI